MKRIGAIITRKSITTLSRVIFETNDNERWFKQARKFHHIFLKILNNIPFLNKTHADDTLL